MVVSTPHGKIGPQEEAFIRHKKAWIAKILPSIQQQLNKRKEFLKELAENRIPYLGYTHHLVLTPGKKRSINIHHGQLIIKGANNAPAIQQLPLIEKGLRQLAKVYLTERTSTLATQCKLSINRVTIKDHKSKWGSCSNKGNINLNWHSIFLPEHIITYLIIHELMHLHEMNHSKRFWNWVARYYPNYKAAQQKLDEHSWIIGIMK